MLRIHEHQMEKLCQQQKQGFVARMVMYLANAHGERVGADRARLETWVEAAVARAESYGVTHEGPVAQYLLLLLVLGDDAGERLPWVNEALSDARLVDVGKLRKLVALARVHGGPEVERVMVVREVCE